MLTPYPGTVDFETLGTRAGWRRRDRQRHPRHAALAHPAGGPSEGLRTASRDVAGRNPAPHASGVGPLLCPATGLAAIAGRRDVEGPARVRAQLEVISTDVCQHRDCDRFRPTHTIGSGRALDGGSVPPALCRSPDAAPRSSPRLTRGGSPVTFWSQPAQ